MKNFVYKTASFSAKILITCLLVSSCAKGTQEQYFEGKVKREVISLAPKYAGRVVSVKVKEGDVVKKGDTLLILDIPEVEAKISQAEGAVLAAGSQYQMAVNGATKEQKEQVIAMYEAAREQYEFAKKTLSRLKALYTDSLISSQSYDEAYTRFCGAKSQFEAASAKKQEVLGGIRDEQVHMALGQKKQAEGALSEAHTVFAERILIAPRNMTIETISLHEGELALPGYNIVIGYAPETAWFRFTIGESQIQKYTVGQEFEIKYPFSNEVKKAKLVYINELSKYGNRSSSYPNYEIGEAVYELKMVPTDTSTLGNVYTNATVLLKK
jgi:HlyD family secretion protein